MAQALVDQQVVAIVVSFVEAQLRRGTPFDAICQALIDKGISAERAASAVIAIAGRNPHFGSSFTGLICDIVGDCNARCTWCVTGATGGGKSGKRFVDVDLFARAMDRLIHMGALPAPPNRWVTLYNWGEPLLHPHFYDIIKILSDREFWINISTNGSIPPKSIDPALLARVMVFGMSMPGFSQQAYDRIHGFNFVKILRNFDSWYHLLRHTHSPDRQISVAFHLYKFTTHAELGDAYIHFKKYDDVRLMPYGAYFADYIKTRDYLTEQMPPELLNKASEELFLRPVNETVRQLPQETKCLQMYRDLVLDENCNVVLCCSMHPAHDEYALGSVFDMSLEEIKGKKSTRPVCRECINTGALLWQSRPYSLFDIKKRPDNIHL